MTDQPVAAPVVAPKRRPRWPLLLAIPFVACAAFFFGFERCVGVADPALGKQMAQVSDLTRTMLDHSLNSPTARALKERPCVGGAAVGDLDELDHLSVVMVGSASATKHDPAIHTDVSCVVSDTAAAPDCDEVAKRFVGIAGHPPGQFFISVRTEPAGKARCRRLYSEAGEKIREDADVMR